MRTTYKFLAFVVLSVFVLGISSVGLALSFSNGHSLTVDGNSYDFSGSGGNDASGTISDDHFSDDEGNPVTLEEYLANILEESELPNVQDGDMPDDWKDDPDGTVYKTYGIGSDASYTRSTHGEECVTVESVYFDIRYKLEKYDGELYLVQYIEAHKNTKTFCGDPPEEISNQSTVAEVPTGEKKKVD